MKHQSIAREAVAEGDIGEGERHGQGTSGGWPVVEERVGCACRRVVCSACEMHAHTARTLPRARARARVEKTVQRNCPRSVSLKRDKYLLGGTNAGAAMIVEGVQVVGGLPVYWVILACVRWRDRVSRVCQRASSMLEGRRGARKCVQRKRRRVMVRTLKAVLWRVVWGSGDCS